MPLLDLRQARADIRLAEVLQLLGWTARARVGVQVRPVGQLEFLNQPLANGVQARQVVDAKGVGRSHRGNDGSDCLAGDKLLAGRRFERGHVNGVVPV